jgi:hypothetical protein
VRLCSYPSVSFVAPRIARKTGGWVGGSAIGIAGKMQDFGLGNSLRSGELVEFHL